MYNKKSRTSAYDYAELLKSSIRDIYSGNTSIERIVTLDTMSTFAGLFNKLDRLITGMFGDGISFEITAADRELFARTFPVVYSNNKDNLEGWLEMLEDMRNINMHARTTTFPESLSGHMEGEFDWLQHSEGFPIVNGNGDITMAGMISIVVSMSNVKMIVSMLKSDKGAIRWYLTNKLHEHEEGIKREDYALDLYKLTNNNFESDIRVYEPGLNVLSAVLGKFEEKAMIDGRRFNLVIKDSELDTVAISGEIEDDHILICSGSNYIVEYREEYCLKINNLDRFVELSSSLPPFAFLAYLKEKGVTEFTDLPTEDLEPLMKLNKPKFYVDKNVRILLLKSGDCDIRDLQDALTGKLHYFFMNFEDIVYGYYSLPQPFGYSTLRRAIEYFDINRNIMYKTLLIRNFFSHCRTLGEWVKTGDGHWYQITLDFILETLPSFADAIFRKSQRNGSILKEDFYYRIIMLLFTYRYKDQINFGDSVFDGSLCGQIDKRMDILDLRITSSCVSEKTEELMNAFLESVDKRGYLFNNTLISSVQKIVIINSEMKQIRLCNAEFNTDKIVLYTTRFSKHEIENIAEFVSKEKHQICTEWTYKVKR